MTREQLIRDGLERPNSAIGYALDETIHRAFPDSYVMRTRDLSFDLDTWLARTDGEAEVESAPHPEWESFWNPSGGVFRRLAQGHRRVGYEGIIFDVIEVAWPVGMQAMTTMWWIGPTRDAVEAFAAHVAETANEVRDEVLVFANGCWQRSPALRESIRDATFESLVLAEGAKEALVGDFRSFLGAREEYERFGVPWKRGALFVGPPGNGKTHAVKALINALDLPCLYVQSFGAHHGANPQACVAAVFDRARRITPCALVLEDLDSLLTPATRSFLLNELDGFASNTGIVTIATTNHPERLDVAIVERPSRFDRKYHFALPDAALRESYLRWWRGRLAAEVSLEDDLLREVAEATHGFSFAYAKELVFSSLVAWMAAGRATTFGEVLRAQVEPLRAQLHSRSPEGEREQYVSELGYPMPPGYRGPR